MLSKTKDSELLHVKALAFRVIKYLLDGIIDGEIKECDFDRFKMEENESPKEDLLTCKICEKSFKTKNGVSIHRARMHPELKKNGSNDSEAIVRASKVEEGVKCDKCSFTFNKLNVF